ncbi:MAG: thioredoxin family protein, partial [Planctomycetota bacterium]
LGVLAASFTELADPSRIFGIWWFTFAMGAIITALGIGSMGAFSINLPQSVYKVNPKADSAHGSFLFGVMTAILGLPCFGFVAGALLPIAASLGTLITILVFVSLGVGMALPYLVLSAKPSLVEKVPRTGPASELVKQVMGLLLIAAGVYFLGSGLLALFSGNATVLPWWGKVVHWWLVAFAALAAGGWLAWRTVAITKRALPSLAMSLAGLLIAGGGAYAAIDSTVEARNNFWNPYSEEAFTQALDDGRIIVVDFTAEWCLNCKALKKAVLNRNPVKPQLLSDQVVPITADLTSSSAPGWDFLRDLGQTGIPTLAVFGPGLERPWVANAYTSQQVLDAIERARG